MDSMIAFNDLGRPSDEALFLLHPLGSNRSFWTDCAEILKQRFRVISFDLRGAGTSPAPDRAWKLADHVQDVVAVRRSLGIETVVAIGCATGSLVAAAFAGAEPRHVRGLVLSNTTRRLGEESRARQQARVDRVMAGGIEALLPDVADAAFRNLPHDEKYDRYIEMYRTNTREGFRTMATGMMGSDVSAELANLHCKALVVAGEHDNLLPPELGQEAHELIPQSEFVIVKGAAHFVPLQSPEAFSALVGDFIDSL